MKYIKGFNEKLKSNTYYKASLRLNKLGHTDRSKNLKDWSDIQREKENLVKWRSNIEEFSKYGLYNINIVKGGKLLKEKFYLYFSFDEIGFQDNYDGMLSESGDKRNIPCLNIGFFIGLIPENEDVLNRCKEFLKEDGDFDNGFYWGMMSFIDFDIKNGLVEFKGFKILSYDEYLSGDVSIADRPSAGKYKNLLKSFFNNSDYPSGNTTRNSIYEDLETIICKTLSFSSEYGFELEDVSKYINTISPNNIYKTVTEDGINKNTKVKTKW